MRKVLLDTNFILTCIKEKIDLFEQLLGYEIFIPIQVISELKKIDKSGLALKILSKQKVKEIDLKTDYADEGIIRFAQENPEFVIATLDRAIKKKIKNPFLTIVKGKKRVELFNTH